MKKIPTQDAIKAIFVYKDGELYWRERGYGRFDKQFSGKIAGFITPNGYRAIRISGYGLIMAHILTWIYHNGGGLIGLDIDHIDGCRANNQIENLRLATRSENLFNSKIRKDNSSGVKGVSWNQKNQNFRARLYVNKKKIEVGSFPTVELAAMAIKMARAKYHGDYSRHAIREGSL